MDIPVLIKSNGLPRPTYPIPATARRSRRALSGRSRKHGSGKGPTGRAAAQSGLRAAQPVQVQPGQLRARPAGRRRAGASRLPDDGIQVTGARRPPGKFRDDAYEDDLTPLLASQYERVVDMAEAARIQLTQNADVAPMLEDGEHPLGGIPVLARHGRCVPLPAGLDAPGKRIDRALQDHRRIACRRRYGASRGRSGLGPHSGPLRCRHQGPDGQGSRASGSPSSRSPGRTSAPCSGWTIPSSSRPDRAAHGHAGDVGALPAVEPLAGTGNRHCRAFVAAVARKSESWRDCRQRAAAIRWLDE